MSDASQTIDDLKGDLLSAHMFTVVGDGLSVSDGVMTSGSFNLSSAAANFSSSDIGKHILVKGAGPTIAYPSLGSEVFIAQYLDTTIASVTSSTVVVLTVAASSNVTGALVQWGTDYTAVIQAAITVAGMKNGVLRFYQGVYHITSEILITAPMTIRLDQCQFIASTDSVFRVQASGVTIDGVHRTTSTLTQVKSTGNVIRVDCHHDFVTVKNCGLIAVPRWYDEANLSNGNAIYAGGSLVDGTCSDEAYSNGHVYEKNHISTGQNGIVLTHQIGARISDNSFTVTDRTGTQRVSAITFGDYKGLSHVTLVQCQFTKCVNNQPDDPVGISNAFYDRIDNNHILPPIADNEVTNNIITGNYRVEVINCGLPRAKVNDNKIYVAVPDTLTNGIRFGFGADDSKAEGNSIYMAANANNLGNGVLILGQDATHMVSGVAINNNTIVCSNGAILLADFTDSCSVKTTQTTILPNMGTPSSMIAISVQGTFCTNHSIQNNSDRGAALGVSLQGAGVASITVRSNVSNAPSSVGISVQDGAGANCIITGNTINSAGIFGVNIVVTAAGPVILGHNYILNSGTAEYNRGIADIVPERHQDANIRQAGFGLDPTHLIDIRDDVGGSTSLKLAGNDFREVEIRVASNTPGANTASILSGVAERGTIDTPLDVTGNNEILRLSSSARFGGVDIPVVFVSGVSDVSGGNVGGQFHVLIKPYGGAIQNALFIDQDGSSTFFGRIILSGSGLQINNGYGQSPSSPNDIFIGAGGTYPDGASLGLGDGSGYKLNLIANVSGSPTVFATFTDTGQFATGWIGAGVASPSVGTNTFDSLDARISLLGVGGAADHSGGAFLKVYGPINNTTLTASEPILTDASKNFVSGQVDLGKSTHVVATGLSAGQIMQWDGSKTGGITGIASASLTEITSGPTGVGVLTSATLTGTVPPGLTLTVTSTTVVAGFGVATHTVTNGVVTS